MARSRFPAVAWGLLVYNLAVIVWGAFVRASFSGDGCGAHWPLCSGQAITADDQIKHAVEFAHRFSSGLSLVFSILLVIYASLAYPRSHRVRLGAWLVFAFTFSEAIVGAVLVLFKLV